MANEDMQQTWTELGTGWVDHEAVFDAIFAPVTQELLHHADLRDGHRVLDVGCGTGTLLAAAVAAGAEAVGVDVSPVMAQAARARVPAATVVSADAQATDLLAAAPGRPFDRVVSRFGVMFFDDPVAAFASVRAACAPGAGLTFACWRGFDENPMMTLGQDLLLAHLDEAPAPPDPGAPGPMAFAEPGRARAVLEGAGWSDVVAAPYDFVCDYAFDGTDGVDHRMATMLSTTTGRRARRLLEESIGPEGWERVVAEVRDHVRDHRVDGTMTLPAAVWLVSARA